MHGNILDANSTNKLINQSVKDAVDDKFIESGYVTKDLLEYALKTQLDTKVDTEIVDALITQVTEIETNVAGKQDKGNYMEYSSKNDDGYTIDCELNTSEPITIDDKAGHRAFVTVSGIQANDDNTGKSSQLTASSLVISNGIKTRTNYTVDGITSNQYNDCLATSDGTFKPISDFVLKSAYDEDIAALEARIAALEAKHPEATA